jgi:hypothetical protein
MNEVRRISTSRLFQTRYITYEATKDELWFQFAKERIEKAVEKNQWFEAQQIANEWADGVCTRLSLESTGIWKFFKRSVAARWFGQVENKRFLPGWSVEEALDYASSLGKRSVRFSLFPEDIACHATSFRLPPDQREKWKYILARVDNSVPMEMFPEACTQNTICFRRYTTLFGEEVVYEAGKGRPMFVFEQERRQHPVILAEKKNGKKYIYKNFIPEGDYDEIVNEIDTELKKLIETHDYELTSRCFGICRTLGIESISIEGCFNLAKSDILAIVDLDLPFDAVFMVSE